MASCKSLHARGLHAGYLAEFMWHQMNTNKDKFLQLIDDINSTFKLKYLHKAPTST